MYFRDKIVELGLNITPKIDRNYFYSLYFREPGGVLFEIATDNPGFTVDEPLEELGHNLKLPAQYESSREEIEGILPKLD
ncbi:putative ring-cleaving dioxygenase MhqE [compost metagenome]